MIAPQFVEHYGTPSPLGDTGVRFRAWRDSDDVALLEIFDDPHDPIHHQDRSLLRPNSDRPWVRTLVVEDEGVPVGAASVSVSELHPQRLWFFAEVVPPLRRRGIASALLEELTAAVPANLWADGATAPAFKIRYTDGTVAEHFAAARGFDTIQSARQILVQPGALPLPELGEDSQLQLQDIATGSVELTSVVQQFYRRTHQWDPTKISVGQTQQLLLAPETGAAGAVVVRDTQAPREVHTLVSNIAAFAVSYQNVTPEQGGQEQAGQESGQELPQDLQDVTDVLLGYHPRLEPARAQHALGALLGMLVHRYPVRLEVDEAMPHLQAVLEPLLKAGSAVAFHTAHIGATDSPEEWK